MEALHSSVLVSSAAARLSGGPMTSVSNDRPTASSSWVRKDVVYMPSSAGLRMLFECVFLCGGCCVGTWEVCIFGYRFSFGVFAIHLYLNTQPTLPLYSYGAGTYRHIPNRVSANRTKNATNVPKMAAKHSKFCFTLPYVMSNYLIP